MWEGLIVELHARQYSFDFYEAANESNCVLESKLTVATVKRDFPKGWSALAPGEVKRIMAGEMKACGQLNSLYSTIFRWVKEQSPELGIDEMGFCLVSTDEIPRDGSSMRLEVVLEPQHHTDFRLQGLQGHLVLQPGPHRRHRVRQVLRSPDRHLGLEED